MRPTDESLHPKHMPRTQIDLWLVVDDKFVVRQCRIKKPLQAGPFFKRPPHGTGKKLVVVAPRVIDHFKLIQVDE